MLTLLVARPVLFLCGNPEEESNPVMHWSHLLTCTPDRFASLSVFRSVQDASDHGCSRTKVNCKSWQSSAISMAKVRCLLASDFFFLYLLSISRFPCLILFNMFFNTEYMWHGGDIIVRPGRTVVM